MKLNKTLYTLFLGTYLVWTGCSRSSDPVDNNQEILPPSAVTLLLPEDETECNTGVVDPMDNKLSTVMFEWTISENTDSYTVTVTDLDTGMSSNENSTTNTAEIKIKRGTPYSWYVISKAEGTVVTEQSQTYRFFNEGPGIENFAPFPAEVVDPPNGASLSATNEVVLEWKGNDIDGDIISYEIFFGTDAEALVSIGTTPWVVTNISNVSVSASTVYFWKVTSHDVAGNNSISELFQFKIN